VGCFSALLARPVWLGSGRFYRQSGSDRALKNSQLTSGKIPRISGTGH
jgi:hypothetical protein